MPNAVLIDILVLAATIVGKHGTCVNTAQHVCNSAAACSPGATQHHVTDKENIAPPPTSTCIADLLVEGMIAWLCMPAADTTEGDTVTVDTTERCDNTRAAETIQGDNVVSPPQVTCVAGSSNAEHSMNLLFSYIHHGMSALIIVHT